MRADGWSAETPAAPSQRQLLMLFQHCLFTDSVVPMMLEKVHWDLPVHSNTTISVGFLSTQPRRRGSGLQRQLPHATCPTSRPWGDSTSSEEQGDCMASTIHNVFPWLNCLPFSTCSSILILLQVLIPPSPKSSVINWAHFDQHYLLF